MDLTSGLPYWLVSNGLLFDSEPLNNDAAHEIAIIGSGITGALVASALCEAGFECCLIDKRMPGVGSTIASTALIQYDIDVPLCALIEKVGEEKAIEAYRQSVNAIDELEAILQSSKIASEFTPKTSLYLAAGKKGEKLIGEEYAVRKKAGLPVAYLSAQALKAAYNIDRPNALYVPKAAQLDAYKTTAGLLNFLRKKYKIEVYSRTDIQDILKNEDEFILKATNGNIIKAKRVICAAGYEAGKFLPRKVMDLISTYAFISAPVNPELLWKERSLIWETASPYFYMRTTDDNRIIMGGEDIAFKNADIRDRQLEKKVKILIEKCNKLFPHIPVYVDFQWCGTFSSTKDGLPFIGEYPGMPGMQFALGYGGNGITFSTIAARMITQSLKGEQSAYLNEIFGFSRIS